MKTKTIKFFTVLSLIEGAIAFLFLMVLEPDPKNAWLFGLSFNRIMMLFGILGGIYGLNFGYREILKGDEFIKKLKIFFTEVSGSIFLYLIIIVLLSILAGVAFAIYQLITLDMYIEIMLRLAPFVCWILLILIQIVLILISFKRISKFGYVIKNQADINNNILPDGTNVFTGFPFYMIFFSIYPILFLFANNIREISPKLLIRPVLASILLMALVFFVHWIILRRYAQKALVVSSILIILFLLYGYIYSLIFTRIDYSQDLDLHKTLTAIFVIIYLLSYKFSNFLISKINILNLVGLTLIVFPIFQIGNHFFETRQDDVGYTTSKSVESGQGEEYPDIYYIILDKYTRSDIMKLFDYDNSYFIEFLKDRGFYVAECSMSNYWNTALSLTSSLNMDYLYRTIPNSGIKDKSLQPLYDYLKQNKVRKELEEMGYEIVFFESGYYWNEWLDADIYLSPESDISLFEANINLFEVMYLQTTYLKVFFDHDQGLYWDFVQSAGSNNYEATHYVLDTLPQLAKMDGPKFVMAHLIVPHGPYVFLPDGSFNEDIAEFGDNFNLEGYFNGVEFISNAIQPVLDEILENSINPPVIIIQGDHGAKEMDLGGEYAILNAYHLPDGGLEYLYPEISPVNSFRLVFNKYFGTEYALLEDFSIDADFSGPYRTEIMELPEHFEVCIPNQ